MADAEDDDDDKWKPHPVPLEDCSAYSFYERHQNFLKNLGGKDINRRAEVYDLAWMEAAGEMMNEQHSMLMAICDKLGIKGGWNE